MNLVILVVSIIGIYCTCYIILNKDIILKEEAHNLQIIIDVYNLDNNLRSEIISKVMCGNYENLLDIVDNIQIN